jgi:serine/threonine protein kinase
MPTILAADLLERVQRSGLVAKGKMSQLLQDLEQRGVDLENAQAIADALVENETLSRWQADNLLQGKSRGFFLGSYRLLKPLGRGGMGAVYLAQHEMMKRRCALKVLPQTQLQEGSSILERFYVEAQAVASLDHPNIVRAYDVNKDVTEKKIVHYLVMEFIDGQDVQNMVQDAGPLDYIKAADYLRQTANGLAHAHEHGLVHRDIKPANVFVDKKGTVKILDLGLARFYDDSQQASLTAAYNETVLGTADYLSPEQALNSHDVDHRTDIYSLGCTAYYMLTGHPPFPDGTVAQRLVAHQVKVPKSIAEERRDAPRDLVAIVERMMAKNPGERYESAAQVSAVLAAWLIQHAGEDWRRQHSDVTADSALLSQLAVHEPTRALTSPASETELELAPLHDEGAKPQGKSGFMPAAAKAASDSKLRPADDSKTRAASDSKSQPAAKPPGRGQQRAPAAVEDLPPLTGSELEPLDSGGFGAAPLEALPDLGSLSAADAFGDLGGTDLAALESASALETMGPGASSGTQVGGRSNVRAGQSSGVRRRAAQAKAPAATQPNYLVPVAVGLAGAIVLLGLFLLLRTALQPARQAQGPAPWTSRASQAKPPPPPEGSAPAQSTVPPASKPAPSPPKPADEKPLQPPTVLPAPATVTSTGDKPPPPPAPVKTTPSATSAQVPPEETKPPVLVEETKPAPQSPTETKPPVTSPDRSKLPPESPPPKPEPPKKSAVTSPPAPTPTARASAATEVAQLPPDRRQDLFKRIDAMGIKVESTLPEVDAKGKDAKDKGKQLGILREQLAKITENQLSGLVQEHLGVKVAEAGEAILRITFDGLRIEPKGYHFTMSATLDGQQDGSSIRLCELNEELGPVNLAAFRDAARLKVVGFLTKLGNNYRAIKRGPTTSAARRAG